MARRRTKKPVEVKTTTHSDKRVNIPTQELSDFMTDEQRQHQMVLYPRDPSLDPQLVWKGKDEQDSADLEVLSKPIYVQEKIHPIAIIDNVKAQTKKDSPEPEQMSLFADFNGLEWEDQIDFYQHDQNWTNRMILGDSLQVMCSLAKREGLKGQVQMIYIDPPYGIKFSSNWQVSTQERSVKDNVKGLTRQPEQVKAFRDTWELGIHSYLAYLRDRLVVARELLTETGSVFVQIGDENVHLVRCLLDEIFGEKNFAGMIVFYKTSSQSTVGVPSVVDYLLLYAKNIEALKLRPILRLKQPSEVGAKQYVSLISSDMSELRPMTPEELTRSKPIPKNWKICSLGPTTSQGYQSNRSGEYAFQEENFLPSYGRHWSYDPSPGMEMDKLAQLGRLRKSGKGLRTILLLEDNPTTAIDNVWMDTGTGSFTEGQVYVVQTGTKVIQRCILMTTDPGDLVLDPTCGSGTTAYVAEQWGRRWITLDTSRVSLALARTRLMSARYPYYQLADPEGKDLKLGFEYKTAPHITLRDIANIPEIDDVHTRWQEKLEPIRSRLNTILKQNWQEWELPREAEDDWSLEAQKLLEEWWELRQKRQAEIDESIARNSEQETLYDQPYEEPRVIRVAGPFTVESLSPYKPISPSVAAAQPTAEREAQTQGNVGKYEAQIIENLREAGVQNTKLGERLEFDLLEPCDGGIYIQAEGEYTDRNDEVKRVAVCIGPEHGTVGKDLIKEAATEAVRGLSADLLLVCGFSFDPEVSEEAKQYGRLMVLPVRMNPDLTMASLLKKTDKANLFMIFGEPDMTVTQENGNVTVKLHGLDIYDPTTGEIRSSSIDDIACWFIDTNYDGNSFFVCHAYFTGAGEPYDKLKRALRTEINEDAWNALYRTESMPFDSPETGKIAVKVINHYGDEVLKVYEVAS